MPINNIKVVIKAKYRKQSYTLVFSFVKNNGGSAKFCYNLEISSCLLFFFFIFVE